MRTQEGAQAQALCNPYKMTAAGVASLPPPPHAMFRMGLLQIETIEIHNLRPRGHEVLNELRLCIVGGVDLSNST